MGILVFRLCFLEKAERVWGEWRLWQILAQAVPQDPWR